MNERVTDLEHLDANTVGHVARALAKYLRTMPADQATPSLLEFAKTAQNVHLEARRPPPVLTSPHESAGLRTPVAAAAAALDGEQVPTYLTRREAAAVLRVDVSTVDRWIAQKRISPVRFGRSIRIPREAIEAGAPPS